MRFILRKSFIRSSFFLSLEVSRTISVYLFHVPKGSWAAVHRNLKENII